MVFDRNAIFKISIHVPLAGDDLGEKLPWGLVPISIHVPLAGDDLCRLVSMVWFMYFYPRPPCGGRPGRRYFGTT